MPENAALHANNHPTPMTAPSTPPGWYGKLPTLGDFASRRLESSFIEPWDAWLAQGIATLREQSGDAWLDAYLASPVWRFVLMPGALPGTATHADTAMAGVLMPSVDRVGRYFPLTLAAPLHTLPSSPQELTALMGWLHQLDDVAADALHDDWDVEQLESELARLPWVCTATAPAPGSEALLSVLAGHAQHASLPLNGRADLNALLGQGAASQWHRATQGLSFWWAESNQEAPRSLLSRGLPQGDGFAALLGLAPT